MAGLASGNKALLPQSTASQPFQNKAPLLQSTARGERSAQAFSCRGPGGVTIDVVNAHAPSGAEKLTDKQRKELLTNLLQSNSMALPGTSLGNGSFLIGGDMNTCIVTATEHGR